MLRGVRVQNNEKAELVVLKLGSIKLPILAQITSLYKWHILKFIEWLLVCTGNLAFHGAVFCSFVSAVFSAVNFTWGGETIGVC